MIKKSTYELLNKKFKDDIWKIHKELRDNAYKINELAQRQKDLKKISKELHIILKTVEKESGR